ncbi:UxaA family hydrolase [Bordetella hinzii]|uniref:UxaA family hydrolase n=1 Tax=Bordetella hinzii TaxID=103855 RepID=UPI0004595FAA|nr:UxaA family hydrolase [Bordetella hinzii]KCB29001.1 D-galactarate dehydratase/altronate hydrolase, C-terminal domain protein [Bordetella hinzii CA90 BAL1384]KCB42923.1 D-galactarate dehydratase/altronate hydrolase, C-terminal domain protein [Bordetella hinzii 4161]KCB51036.1 D-galactarate dehydratase/altronate hydrolase, C-terminal domain protein [Bordetella hinzii 1277]KXA70996.1 altronate hydrolase [Bordetella hinzii LMG 13501]MCJ9708381.1 UxaA family hydrolase [Bordetella hinzii]
MSGQSFLGYARPDGSVGVRNSVGVLSLMDNSNPIVRQIVALVKGTVPITTLFVRGQYGRDLQITYDTMVGQALNPNLAAIVVIGLEPKGTRLIVERIRAAGKPVSSVVVQEVGGTLTAVAEGARAAARYVREASRLRRTPQPLSRLRVGLECGGSDTTSGLASNPAIGHAADRLVAAGAQVIISETLEFLGGEHLFARRAVDPAVGEQFLAAVRRLEAEALARGVDLTGVNPAPDNIRGGLTTIEEKALGAIAKAGSSPLVEVLGYGQPPTRPGLSFMDTPAPAVESLTAFAAGGAQLALFSTGVGNPVGNPIMASVKITANPHTARDFADNVDGDISGILTAGLSVRDAGDILFDIVVDAASGTLTTAEILGQQETAISRFEPSS